MANCGKREDIQDLVIVSSGEAANRWISAEAASIRAAVWTWRCMRRQACCTGAQSCLHTLLGGQRVPTVNSHCTVD